MVLLHDPLGVHLSVKVYVPFPLIYCMWDFDRDCQEKALTLAFFQTTRQKRRLLLLEDGFQGEQVA